MNIKELYKEKKAIFRGIITSFSLIIVSFFYLPLANAIPIFFILILSLCEVAFLLACIIYFILNYRRKRVSALILLVISIGTLLILYITPISTYWSDVNFAMLLNKRKEVIADIEQGKLGTGAQEEVIKLPAKYRGTSKDGIIKIQRNQDHLLVTFDTYKTWIDNFEGFVYCSTGKEPSVELLFYKGAAVIFTRKRENWFLFEHI